MAYTGDPVLMDDLLFRPVHSLIDQSLHSKMGATTTNGDGFGIGWYGEGPRPALFKCIEPAWNESNLRELATQIRTPLMFAHVRASTGTPVQRTNCHPFRYENRLWMHNGAIREFDKSMHELRMAVDPDLFPSIEGTTDSETMFYLALTFGLEVDPPAAVERMVGRTDAHEGRDVREAPDLGVGNVAVAVAVGIVAHRHLMQPDAMADLDVAAKGAALDLAIRLDDRLRAKPRHDGAPWMIRRRISVRANNIISERIKVNDLRGNPIEMAAQVVWRVVDTAQALFEVDDFTRYVSVQAEAALRHLAAQYAYDDEEDLEPGELTLRGGASDVALALMAELTARFEAAGVETIDAKLTHLAYAPEIAQVMLRRQQAQAIISARSRIVHGAVTMVEDALKGLAERDIVELDAEHRQRLGFDLCPIADRPRHRS